MLPHIHNDAEACVEAVLSQVGRKIVLAMPIAIGKPNHFVNALYRRAVRDKSISLTIFTALSFVKPTLKGDLERRFAGPLVQRIFGQFPDLEYAAALQRGQLPPNIEVHDFFFQAGAFLNSPLAQQGYTSLNYTYATKHFLTLGVNVFGKKATRRLIAWPRTPTSALRSFRRCLSAAKAVRPSRSSGK
jgi:hypothetical protein